MGLTRYRQKRSFKETPEPRGRKPAVHEKLTFVIQKHAASRLHYDFRLELDGVLKSWAVPKGPSLDPAVKALAVEVEDHPLEYGGFEGTIPAGNYGAGDVIVWDNGEWIPEGDPRAAYRAGRLKFELRGKKLRGLWNLIRIRNTRGGDSDKQHWLLFKHQDKYARPAADYNITTAKPASVISKRKIEGRKPKSQRPVRVIPASSRRRAIADQRAPQPAPAIKMRSATTATMPQSISPQLATLADRPPAGDEWIHEIKFDGYRLLAFKDRTQARLLTRKGLDWTAKFGPLAAAVRGLPVRQAILDGEVVVRDAAGLPDFQQLQNVMRTRATDRLAYYLFDLLYLDGKDLRLVPLIDRKEKLRQLLASHSTKDVLLFSAHLDRSGPEVLRSACQQSLEGIVSKRRDAPYEERRSRSWIKTKCSRGQELVIGGYTDPAGTRTGFGALLVGYYEGDALKYCGRVGTGFDETALSSLFGRLHALEISKPAFANPPRGSEARGVHWVEPRLVAEIQFAQVTQDGILRHPVFHGLREDKPAREVIWEKASGLANATAASNGAPKPATTQSPRSPAAIASDSPNKRVSGKKAAAATLDGVRITSPERLLFPDAGVTKLDLARYFDLMSDYILPHVVNRPLMVFRCPAGRGAACFYQKHWTKTLPPNISGVPIREKNKREPYLVIQDKTGLIALAQIAALEIHGWQSTVAALETPDRIIFDLDPGPGVQWSAVIEAAQEVRDHLRRRKLTSFVKTSGGKGLHVVVPLQPRAAWDQVKEFSHAVSESVSAGSPGKYVTVMTKSRRDQKIYIDYQRNGRGATCVTVLSPRARPNAPLSAPVSWKDLKALDSAADFTLANLSRHARAVTGAWRDYFDTRQTLPAD